MSIVYCCPIPSPRDYSIQSSSTTSIHCLLYGKIYEQRTLNGEHLWLLDSIGGSRGRAQHTPPTGPNSFVFAYIFSKKHPRQRSMPPWWVHAPLQEILDPPLMLLFYWCLYRHLCDDELWFVRDVQVQSLFLTGLVPYSPRYLTQGRTLDRH